MIDLLSTYIHNNINNVTGYAMVSIEPEYSTS